jgi:2'-hydroxyisoflavone reductase
MRILIVGGTIFVGRALTEAALDRGHQVTLLNRGKHTTGKPNGVELIRADRDQDLSALQQGTWDAVIDTCAYFPRQVRTLLAALPGKPHYTLISSVSAYADFSRKGLSESAALSLPSGEEVQKFDRETYGPLKSACEQVAGEQAGARSLLIRPGIIVGPYDSTGRFAYWVRRLAAGAPFIAPGDGSSALQVIDARDLGDWIVRLIEQKTTGAYNAVGPETPLSFKQFIETGMSALGSAARPVWVDEAKLAEHKIEGGSMLPLWIPTTASKHAGMFWVDGRKAYKSGLNLRSLEETIRDVSRYEAGVSDPIVVGLPLTDEQKLLGELGAS